MLHKKTSLTSLLAGALLAGSLSMGCAYNIKTEYHKVECKYSLKNESEIKKLDAAIIEYEKKHDLNPESVKMRILMSYFTPEAFEKLKDIPIVEARFLFDKSGYAGGRNFFLNILQSMAGYGWGRKTVVKNPKVKEVAFNYELLHEFVHHASALDLIDDDEFEKAWEKMSKDPKYTDLTKAIDDSIDEDYCPFFMFIAPIWKTIEREAILAAHVSFGKFRKEMWVTDECINITTGAKTSITHKENVVLSRELPDYMQKVYEKTLVKVKYVKKTKTI